LQDARWLLVLSFLAVFLIIVIGLAVVALPQEASTPMTPGRPRAETPTISEGLTAPQVSEPFSPFLSREDRNRLVQIAQDYSDPRQRDTVPDTMAPGEILRRGADFEGKTVTVEAEVSKKTLLYDLQLPGWPICYFLLLEGEDGVLPVLYRGAIHDVHVGNRVRVTGVFSEEGSGISVDEIVSLDWLSLPTSDFQSLVTSYVVAGMAVLALFVASLLLLVASLRGRSTLK